MSQPRFTPTPDGVEATEESVLHARLASLRQRASSWKDASAADCVRLVQQLRKTTHAEAHTWAELVGRAKGGSRGSEEYAEALGDGPISTLRGLRLLESALLDLDRHGTTLPDTGRISERPDGRVVAQVFPNNLMDRLIFSGFSAEIWMDPSVSPATLQKSVATEYPQCSHDGRVVLVLGAGNISSIPPLDVFYKVFVDKCVCILKLNPVNDYLAEVFERTLAPLIEEGLVAMAYGGVDVGVLLSNHDEVDEIHITGSDRTYDAMVWGPEPGQADRKAAGERQNHRDVSAELGNISPIIVVPGAWSEAELVYQARNVASMVVHNASFNCAAGKLVVTAADWPQRGAFLAELRRILKEEAPPRKAYYPGAVERWKKLCDAYPQAEVLGRRPAPEVVPWTLISDLSPSEDELCYEMEPFCGVLSEVSIPGATAVDFLPAAVSFLNEKVWGTLCATILIHPATRRDSAQEQAFQESLDDLRYGSIVVNHWAGIGYGLMETTWGAHPGHPAENIESGCGVVHNSFFFGATQKSVIYGPFRAPLKLPWFYDHKRKAPVMESLLALEAEPSLLKLPPLVWHSLLA